MNTINGQEHFEREKNLKALGMTILVTGSVFLLFFLVSWTLPVIPPPPVDEGVEVNLGNTDQGMGSVAPQIPGNPTLANETVSHPPPSSASRVQPDAFKEVADNNEPDAPAIRTAAKPLLTPHHRETAPPVKRNDNKPTLNPTPARPRPKALYHGGTNPGSGGNTADSYNGVKDQGIAGGKGDQGSPNGNPNSDSYTGNGGSGNSGVVISRGLEGRSFRQYPSFQDNFNQNAKVAVDITVDRNGNVIKATIQPRNTTTTNDHIRAIAISKAKQLKLSAGNVDEQSGTIMFTFKLQN